jgi:hypothetical protein
LIKDKKRTLIPYGFHIIYYFVKDTTQAKHEGLSHMEYRFDTGRYRRHDPKGLVPKHVENVPTTGHILMKNGKKKYLLRMHNLVPIFGEEGHPWSHNF